MQLLEIKRGNSFFRFDTYYIYKVKNDNIFVRTSLSNTYIKIITKVSEVEILKLDDVNFSLSTYQDFKKNILLGKICCIILYNNFLIHENWIAMNEQANKDFENWHPNINWSEEATWGNAKTYYKFKNKGLYSYSLSHIFKYLYKNRIYISNFSIKKKNYYSNKAVEKFNPKKIAIGYRFVLLKSSFSFLRLIK